MHKAEIAKHLVAKLQAKGHIAYFAGGCVRDLLLKLTPDDYDIATSASLEQIQSLFPHNHPVGAKFGIVIVIAQNEAFEVATFRKDGPYLNGRAPESVSTADAKEDAKRRDFTFNGIFYDPIKEIFIDYVEGEKDLKLKQIKTIGQADCRFQEDRLRMLRACRFAATLGFHIEKNTFDSIQKLACEIFPSVSVERVWQELQKTHKRSCLASLFVFLHKTGLLPHLLPGLSTKDANDFDSKLDLLKDYHHALPLPLFFCILYEKASKQKLLDLLLFYKVSKAEYKLVEYWFLFLDAITEMKSSHYPLVKALTPEENACFCFAFINFSSASEVTKKALENKRVLMEPHLERRRKNQRILSSIILLENGISPGKHLGKLLELAEQIAVDRNLHLASDVLDQLKSTPLWKSE